MGKDTTNKEFWNAIKQHSFDFEWSENPPTLKKLWNDCLKLYGNAKIKEGKSFVLKGKDNSGLLFKSTIAISASTPATISISPLAGLTSMVVITAISVLADSKTTPIQTNFDRFVSLKQKEYNEAIYQWLLEQGFTARYSDALMLKSIGTVFKGSDLFNETTTLKLRTEARWNHYELTYTPDHLFRKVDFLPRILNSELKENRKLEIQQNEKLLKTSNEIEYLDI
jgi:hypothetical protein